MNDPTTFSRYLTSFQKVYQRNNKAKTNGKDGMKNIRCFPCCNHTGHVAKGFCGGIVEFVVSNAHSSTHKAWAQFELADGSNRTVTVGQVFDWREVEKNLERNRDDLAKPWFPALPISNESLKSNELGFQVLSLRGWNYSWTSNVHTCDATHRLCVYLFKVADASTSKMVCVDVIKSPEFQVFCSRRRRTPSSPMSVISPQDEEKSIPVRRKRSRSSMDVESPNPIPIPRPCWDSAHATSTEMNAANLLMFVRSSGSLSSTGTSSASASDDSENEDWVYYWKSVKP